MPKKDILHGTGALISTIPHSSIHADPSCSVSQQEVTHLTSYDLLPKNRKTIIVPGSPAIWTPRQLPIRIPADKGHQSIDPVRLIFPSCPLEPVFRALSTHCASSTFSLPSTNLITDRRNLRRLLNFAGDSRAQFRIDTEVVGETVMFSVWTEVTYQPAGGYGLGFEEAFTTKPGYVKESIRHNRVVGYTLGGVRMVVRFEVDGCAAPAGAQIQGGGGTTTTPTGYTVVNRGVLAAEEGIMELKTGKVDGSNIKGTLKHMGQLWFSRTPIFVRGYHEGEGTFSKVEEENVEGYLKEWEETNKERLQRFVKLLRMIWEILVDAEAKKCALILRKGSEELEIYELDEAKYGRFGVPEDIRARWD
ncbi:hypothetical protein K440DRAFT_633807 [Wilcoxina mikolae CBS 423.85]|nr:hypothetical protein K440DRAFT_633807 [Wilcoxina mikolae CBS 423.85]